MRTSTIVLALSLCVAVHAAPKAAPKPVPCTVPANVLDVYANVENVSPADWNAARVATRSVITSCTAAPPQDAASRALLFSLLKQEMLVYYEPLLAKWQKRGDEYTSETTADGILSFQTELQALMDRMVGPQDIEHANVVLEYADGLAIANLGGAIKEEVLRQSRGRARFIYGLVLHNRQEENFRAIGYWLDAKDKTLTAAEKKSYALSIAEELPADGVVRNEAHQRMMKTLVDALRHSKEPSIQAKVRAWDQR